MRLHTCQINLCIHICYIYVVSVLQGGRSVQILSHYLLQTLFRDDDVIFGGYAVFEWYPQPLVRLYDLPILEFQVYDSRVFKR